MDKHTQRYMQNASESMRIHFRDLYGEILKQKLKSIFIDSEKPQEDIEMDERKIKMLCETMFDLTYNFMLQVQYKNKDMDEILFDSRDLFQNIYSWATEFERTYDEDMDYLENIDIFFWEKIKEEYPELY